ncbi:hypothetical protein BU17DRAFT_85167 [Hysterangium stoloniferum]|nr:hypothetical protein BU17DRAFT_85167 [Hysterangium stoloniferum]
MEEGSEEEELFADGPSQESSPQSKSADNELEHLMKYWVSPVYAFFDPTPKIADADGHWAHKFKCSAWGCKVTVWRYLDKKDVRSSNMCKHVKGCWGDEVLNTVDDAKNADEV